MLWAIAEGDTHGGTRSANQFRGLEIVVVLRLLTEVLTTLKPTKVRLLAFKTHIIRVNRHRVLLRLVVVGIALGH